MQTTTLGTHLLERGLLTRSQLAYALQKQKGTKEPLAQLLARLGLVSNAELAKVLAIHHGLPYAETRELPQPQQEALSLFKRDVCMSHGFIPVAVSNQFLDVILGVGDPEKVHSLVKRRTGLEARLRQGDFAAVSRLIDIAYVSGKSLTESAFEKEYQKLRHDQLGELSVDDLLNGLLNLAVAERATDIHLQPESNSIHVSFRIDGVLNPIVSMDRSMMRLVSAIKVRAAMDISDSLRPQDGRFTVKLHEQTFDIRISTSITPYGENVVMRLLQKGTFVSGLRELGFMDEHVNLIDALFREPYGIFLMTGPTGSGKTTTLYAGLKPLGLTGKSILTIEDPIEYEMAAACQTQVNRKSGYTFDSGIRHFLRHDPDIILVGEIRDQETAEAAMRAAETGHLVLSTLHVNSVFSIVSRLAAMQITAQVVAETLIGCINQRLVRRICDNCKVPDEETGHLPPRIAPYLQDKMLYRGTGCDLCRHTGYVGRLPVYEILVVDAQVARWIESGARRQSLGDVLSKSNYVDMAEVFARRVVDGETSIEEFSRTFQSAGQWR
jgi:type II secretory ATPase GspE/PulE/Tfp pilus assembly ATPase PilB-like protein